MLSSTGLYAGVEPGSVPGQIKARYGDIIDRTSAAYANIPKEDRVKIIAELTAA